jgi:hypothetical protein
VKANSERRREELLQNPSEENLTSTSLYGQSSMQCLVMVPEPQVSLNTIEYENSVSHACSASK